MGYLVMDPERAMVLNREGVLGKMGKKLELEGTLGEMLIHLQLVLMGYDWHMLLNR
jgi:hypothetical protein|uniref:Uncharacterized protein n=1 Tax=Picea glauca TaxID=3330 RepID=A0A101M2L0_PICGL|nr:hypothetical protein ABT39_MTgene2995 [Picea glauca]QHR91892.1 hypothetical protein Q903MT_gene5928 [Picea sitchensis]